MKKEGFVELYLSVKAKASLEQLRIDKDIFLGKMDALIENAKTDAEDIIDRVFVLLYQELNIEQIRFPVIDSKNLPLKERLQIQKYVENMNYTENGQNDNSTPNYTPFATFYKLFYRFKSMNKIEYAFSYLLERNLIDEEQEIIARFYQICSDGKSAHIAKDIVNEIIPERHENEIKQLILCHLIDLEERRFQEYNIKERSGGLYNKLLDTMLYEIQWYSLKHIMLYASKETITYNELIKECIKDDSSNFKFKDYIVSQGDVLRKLVSDIYRNNDEKKYYQQFRWKKVYDKQNTISCYEKDIYKIIYLLHNRRSRRQGYDCYTKEDIEEYNNLLEIYWQDEFSSAHKMSELATCYKDYVDYILKYKPIKKTANLQDSVKGIILLQDILMKHFKQNPETCWVTMSSIFSAPWEFIKAASYAWNEKKEHLTDDETLKKEHKQILFMHYCRKISQMDLPETQKLLIEDVQFFEVYLNSPYWLDNIIMLVKHLTGITGYYISYMNGLSDEAFSQKSEKLVKIKELLRKSYCSKHRPKPHDAPPEMITDFLSFYLTSKAK